MEAIVPRWCVVGLDDDPAKVAAEDGLCLNVRTGPIRRTIVKRWMKRIAIAVILVGAAVFVSFRLWMAANAADIEFTVLSGLKKGGTTYKVNSPTGPSDDVLGRLRKIGIKAVRKTGDDGITLSITPTGPFSARVAYEELYGSLYGSGYDIFIHKVDGQWTIERAVHTYQV